jgi:hypothetical protein
MTGCRLWIAGSTFWSVAVISFPTVLHAKECGQRSRVISRSIGEKRKRREIALEGASGAELAGRS